jgi:hypothetical protein
MTTIFTRMPHQKSLVLPFNHQPAVLMGSMITGLRKLTLEFDSGNTSSLIYIGQLRSLVRLDIIFTSLASSSFLNGAIF